MRADPDRILTTHVGSLPRDQAVVALLARKEGGLPYDTTEFDHTMSAAVQGIVARQCASGVDVASDGEQSKPSYAPYIKDRLSGFSSHSKAMRGAELDDSPQYLARLMSRRGGAIKLARPCRTGPIAVEDRAPLTANLQRFRAALDAVNGGAKPI